MPWRKRPAETWSKETSTTISGSSGVHWLERSSDQRLGPPGASPVNPEPPTQRLQALGQGAPIDVGQARGEADVIETSILVVKAQEQRGDQIAVLAIAKTADHAVGRPLALDLDHRPLALRVGAVQTFGDDALELALVQPSLRPRQFGRPPRQGEGRIFPATQQCGQGRMTFAQRPLAQVRAIGRLEHVEQARTAGVSLARR